MVCGAPRLSSGTDNHFTASDSVPEHHPGAAFRFSKKEKGGGKEKEKEEKSKHGGKRRKHEHPGSGKESSRSEPGDVKKEVGSWIKRILDPLVDSKQLGKSEASTVLTKSVAKLAEAIAAHQGKAEPFMTTHRQGKVRDLVDKYVQNVAGKKEKH